MTDSRFTAANSFSLLTSSVSFVSLECISPPFLLSQPYQLPEAPPPPLLPPPNPPNPPPPPLPPKADRSVSPPNRPPGTLPAAMRQSLLPCRSRPAGGMAPSRDPHHPPAHH